MKVSQITTVYNVEEWLEKTIQSFLTQTLKESELVLVNDCSPDGCADIIAKYANNPRIKVVNNEYNVGAGISRQIGVDTSIGEYTIFVDGDD
jgi:glycosyltransferase involved in cell wall biosynthesis